MQDKKLKTLTGTVVSRSGDKSAKVMVEYKIKHPRYGKYIKRHTNFSIHDHNNECAVGDVVEIAQCRPLSKTKSHRLIKILQKSIDK